MENSNETFRHEGQVRARRQPTMREVAAVAGVSLSTVSRAVNGDPAVRADLAQRVRDAVDVLGYRRDLTASTLRRADRHSASIGLVLEDVSNPFLAAVHRGIEEVAWERGVLTFAGSSDDDPVRERRLAHAFFARRVDGMIIVPTVGDHGYLLPEREAGLALVFVDRPPRFLDADAVLSENAGGARAAVAHLAAAGHRRIACIADRQRIYTAAERVRGYQEALGEAGIPYDPALVRTEISDVETARGVARELLGAEDPPTAVFTAQNLITIGTIQALRSAGLQRQVALVGFDDVVLADALDPGLTVIAQDAAALGRAAAQMLFSRLEGDTTPSQRVMLNTTLIPRGSGEVRPRGDR
jgi:LacI family transcriptional regulator, galactose operon repressor